MCTNMEPGSPCPLDGEMLCRNQRPQPVGQAAATPACNAAPAADPAPSPVVWEPPRGTGASAAPRPLPS